MTCLSSVDSLRTSVLRRSFDGWSTHEQTHTYLPPERHTEGARQGEAEEELPPVSDEEGEQWQQHVAHAKEHAHTHRGENGPNTWT